MQQRKAVNIQIGANIRAARIRAGYTQERLSECLNITPNHLSAMERGVTGATVEKIMQVCQLFGVSADSLLFGEKGQEDFGREIALQANRVRPECRPQLRKILAAFLEALAQEKQ